LISFLMSRTETSFQYSKGILSQTAGQPCKSCVEGLHEQTNYAFIYRK
jgi:hypothetical protein